MLTYRNTKTGAVITVPCPVSGDWELVSEKETTVAEAVEEPKAEPKPKRKRTVKK